MNIVHQNIYLAMYFHIVQLLPTFQTSLVLVYCVPAKLRGGGYKQSTHKQVEEGCKFEKHSIQQAHVAQLSLSVARASESRWRKIESGMGTGEGPEGVFILKQLEQKENQDDNRPFQVHVCKIKHTYREPEWWSSLCLSTR